MEAISYLDKVNGTDNGNRHKKNRNTLQRARARNRQDDKRTTEYFEEQIRILKELNQYG